MTEGAGESADKSSVEPRSLDLSLDLLLSTSSRSLCCLVSKFCRKLVLIRRGFAFSCKVQRSQSAEKVIECHNSYRHEPRFDLVLNYTEVRECRKPHKIDLLLT